MTKRKVTIYSIFILILGCIITFFLNFEANYIYSVELLKRVLNLILGGSGRILYGVGYIIIGINWALSEQKEKSNLEYVILFPLIALIVLVPSTIKQFVLIPIITILFEKITEVEIKTKYINYKLLRTMSTVTYFTHMIVYFVYTLLINDLNSRGFIPFIICVIVTWILGILYFYGKQYKYNKRINFNN